jgi:squalene synthase HpnC
MNQYSNRVVAREPVNEIGPWSFGAFRFHAGALDADTSKRYCRNLAAGHHENFPIILSLFPADVQEGLAAVYAFARTADDFADEPAFGSSREALLDLWEAQLDACFKGDATHPVFIALRDTVGRFKLDRQPFADLLDAFRQDCRKNRHRTYAELAAYCRRSANPVGRIVLRILGCDREAYLGWSDDICTALQLTNFWQDLSVDIPRDRLYIPLEDLDRFRISVASLRSGEPPEAFGDLMRHEVDRTRRLFQHGRPLIACSGYPEVLYLAGVWLGGRTVLRMVDDLGARILHTRPRLKAGSLARAWLKAAPRKIAAYSGEVEWIH